MKRMLFVLAMFLACGVAMAQRGANRQAVANLLPTCSATTGNCPSDNYFCVDSIRHVYRCVSPATWTNLDSLNNGSTLPATCSVGDLFLKTNATTGQQLYACETANTWAQQAGGGGGGSTTFSALDDTTISAPASANIIVYQGGKWKNKSMGPTGDATISAEGALTIAADAVALSTDTTGAYVGSVTSSQGLVLSGGGVENDSVGIIDCAANEIMKRNVGDTAWECAADDSGSGGSAQTLDLGDDGGNDSTNINEIATTGDTGTVGCSTAGTAGCIFTMPVSDKLLIDMSLNWPSADTADALSSNAANCAASNIPLGVDASGAVEGCYQPATTDLSDSANVPLLDTANVYSLNQEIDDALFVDGDGDEVQLRVQANGTQTANVIEIQDSSATVMTSWDVNGSQTITAPTASQTLLRLTGHGTQNADILVIEENDGTDLLAVSPTELVIGDFGGDENRGLELIDNTSICKDPSGAASPTGSTSICTVAGELHRRDTGGTTVNIEEKVACQEFGSMGAGFDLAYIHTFRYASTIKAVSCTTNSGSIVIDIENSNGGTDVESSITCDTSPPTTIDSTLSGTATFAAGESVRIDIGAGSPPTYSLVCVWYTVD